MSQVNVAIMVSSCHIQREILEMLLLKVIHELVGITVLAFPHDAPWVDVIACCDHKINTLIRSYLVHGISDMVEVRLSEVSKVTDHEEGSGLGEGLLGWA